MLFILTYKLLCLRLLIDNKNSLVILLNNIMESKKFNIYELYRSLTEQSKKEIEKIATYIYLGEQNARNEIKQDRNDAYEQR